MTSYFLITSYGRTATMWLATTLAKIEKVAVSHGPLPIPLSKQETNKPTLAEQHAFLSNLPHITVDEYLRTVAKAKPQATCAGNVHAFTAASILARRKTPFQHPITIVNITRHPITRIDSFARHWAREIESSAAYHSNANRLFWNSGIAQAIRQREASLPNSPTVEQVLFLRSVFEVLSNDRVEVSLAPGENVPMERLTQDAEALRWLVQKISGGDLSCDDAIHEQSVLGQPINRSERTPLSSKKTWNAWDDWQRRAFLATADSLGLNLKMYDAFKYDLSFAMR